MPSVWKTPFNWLGFLKMTEKPFSLVSALVMEFIRDQRARVWRNQRSIKHGSEFVSHARMPYLTLFQAEIRPGTDECQRLQEGNLNSVLPSNTARIRDANPWIPASTRTRPRSCRSRPTGLLTRCHIVGMVPSSELLLFVCGLLC